MSYPKKHPTLKTIEILRQRLDNHGYVSQATRTHAASKNATNLRDSLILAGTANIAQRQHAFQGINQSPTGNFTTTHSKTSIPQTEEDLNTLLSSEERN